MTSERFVPLSEYHRLPQPDQTSDVYKRLLEVVCNNATLALFIMDEHQQCIYMNPAAETLTGYRLAETKGRALHDVIHHTRPDGRPYPLCECPIDQAFPQNNQEQGEEVFVHKDGHFYPVAYTASPIREGDRITGTIIEVRDITQDKLAEQARREASQLEQALRIEAETAQQRVEIVLSSISDGVFVLDSSWRYLYANDRLCEMAGKSCAELLGISNWDLFPAAVDTEVYVQFHRAMHDQVQVQFEYHYLPWDRWFEYRVYPSEQGITVFAADITERIRLEADRQQAEAELQTLNQQLTHRVNELQTLFDLLPIGVAIAEDPDCRTVLANAHLSELLRVPVEANASKSAPLNEQPLYRLCRDGQEIPAEDLPMQVAARRNTDIRDVVLDLVHPDGTVIKLLSYASPLIDGHGQVRGALGAFVDITQRVSTETALRESEERLLFALTAARMVAWEWDLKTTTSKRLGNTAEVLGLDSNDVDEFYQRIHPEDLPAVEAAIARTVQGEAPYAQEFRLLTADGRTIWVADKAHLRYDEEGNPCNLTGVCVDITERKQVEEALRESMAILNTVNQATPNLIYVKDRQGKLLMANPATARALGQPEGNVVGQRELDFLGQEVAQQIVENDRQVMETGQVHVFEETVVLPHETRTYLSTKSPYRDSQGTVMGLIGVSMDITDRKETEMELERLLARERYYANQLQGLTTAALAINDSALSVEQALQVITDQSAAIIGAHQAVTIMPSDANWTDSFNAFYLSEKYARWWDYTVKPDGSGIYSCVCHLNRPMRMTQAELEAHPRWRSFGQEAANHPPMRGWLAAPMVGRDGKNIGLIQLSDKYEGEFTEADEAILVQLTQMASVAVENARLYEAEQQARAAAEASREEAQAANRIKDEFLAVLSHELRSPLNPILGWANLLQTGRLDQSKTQQALKTIERNAKLQAELIDDLLDVSRILRGKLSLSVSPVNLASTIRAAIETVRLAAEAKSIQIEARLVADASRVSGDPTRLQQVVWNLLSNAVKFTSVGGQVTVTLQQEAGEAHIIVADTGKGIAPDFLPYVFDYFRQEDGATTRKFGGLGLGLAIVRHLVELHGGTIQASSPGEGLGATFLVKLPLMPSPLASSPQPPAAEAALDLRGLRVVVVDDDTDTREFTEFLLKEAGATVLGLTAASEVISALSQFQPDVLLSDIGMPDMDGYMLIRHIRDLPPEQGGQIPAIALTAYAGESDQQQALEAGFQQHLAKPIDPQTLIQTINRLRSSSRAAMPRSV